MRGLLDDAETGQRGYLLTGEPKYRTPYEDARAAIPRQLDRVRALMADDQKATVAALSDAVPAKLAELQQTIDLHNAGKQDEALALVKS